MLDTSAPFIKNADEGGPEALRGIMCWRSFGKIKGSYHFLINYLLDAGVNSRKCLHLPNLCHVRALKDKSPPTRA